MTTPLDSYIKSLVKIAVMEALMEFRAAAQVPPYELPQPVSQPPAAPSVPPQTPPPAATVAPSAPEAVTTYEPIGALIKSLATTKRAQVLAILGEHGAKKGGELKAADYPAVYTKLKALEGAK